jgi:hypothetical protein
MKKFTVFQFLGFAALTIVLALGCSENSIQEPSVSLNSPDPGESMFGGSQGSGDVALAEDGLDTISFTTIQGGLESVDYNALKLEDVLTFGDVEAAPKPGVHHDLLVESGCAGIAERFVGQTRSTVMVGSYPHDALSANASGPLALASGAPDENVGVATETTCGASEVLVGWGPLGYPELWGGGEGSIAILFADDQSEFGLRMCGGNSGQVYFNFFGRDGSLLGSAVVYRVREAYFGFKRIGGVADIAGVSIHNVDVGGVAIDDLTFDVSTCNDCVGDVGVRVTPETFNVARYGNFVTGHVSVPDGYEFEDVTGATIVSIGGLATSIAGAHTGGPVWQFSSDEFAGFAGQLVGPEEPRMEDVSVCVEFTFSDGTTSCGSCWMIDIINEGHPGGPDDERSGSPTASGDFDSSSQ